MKDLEKYHNFCLDFGITYSKPFTNYLNEKNKIFGKYKFNISYNIEFNIKNYFENVKLYTDKNILF